MDFDYQLYKLTSKFMSDYPISSYPEILSKPDRPHYCLLIDTHCDYFICVPFRSNIGHNNAYLFKGTKRSKRSRSGLDYSKIAIIKDIDYLDDKNVVVDQDEYVEAIRNAKTIVADAVDYVETYIGHINGTAPLHTRDFERKYKFSTLKYYHNILGLDLDINSNVEETHLFT